MVCGALGICHTSSVRGVLCHVGVRREEGFVRVFDVEADPIEGSNLLTSLCLIGCFGGAE